MDGSPYNIEFVRASISSCSRRAIQFIRGMRTINRLLQNDSDTGTGPLVMYWNKGSLKSLLISTRRVTKDRRMTIH